MSLKDLVFKNMLIHKAKFLSKNTEPSKKLYIKRSCKMIKETVPALINYNNTEIDPIYLLEFALEFNILQKKIRYYCKCMFFNSQIYIHEQRIVRF